jgi:hypothetical protein
MIVNAGQRRLPHRAAAHVLTSLDQATVVQLLGSLSGIVNARVSHSRALAFALMASGSQRLSRLTIIPSRLHLPIELSRVLASPRVHRTAEELALTLALLELYIGLLLRFFTREANRLPARTRKNPPPPGLPAHASPAFRWPRHLFPRPRSNPPGLLFSAATR